MAGKGEFTPRMRADVRLYRTLIPLSYRRLSGAVADVWSVRGEAGGGGFYIAPDPRIVIFLDDEPPDQALRTREQSPDQRGTRALYIPGGVPVWSRMETAQEFNHVDFHLEASALQNRLAAAAVHSDLSLPRLIPFSPTLLTLGRLAAQEIRQPSRGAMMLDGLLLAALGEMFTEAPGSVATGQGRLTAKQMAAVDRHLRQNLTRQVSVAELAEVAGLSVGWFSHCFRQHSGETPQRWQARIRLETACDLMADPASSLADIAHAAGFYDQAHLSRQFRARHGVPPSTWRRNRFPAPRPNPSAFVQDSEE